MSNLDFSQSIAIVIGINNYGGGISPLRTAVADAEAIAQTLQKEHEYTTITLLNEQANLSSLRALIQDKLPNLLTPNSRLLLYFAGHGIAQDGDDGPEGYLIPQDACPGAVSSYLPMVELHDALTALPCRHFLAIFDCCFAGAFRWSSTRDIDFIPEVIHRERYDRFRQDPAWQVITSASYNQKALDVLSLRDDRGTTGQHSPFANALLNALQGEADAFPPAKNGQPAGDGVITATELYLYLRNSVEVLTEGQQKRQTPELCPLRNHDKGEFIFLTPGHTLNLPPAPELNQENNPYRGLESFDAEHHDLFFGRDKEIAQLLQRLETPHPLTVVLGASGTGKSSLVKAGLLPQLADRPEFQVLPVMRPGRKPLDALARSFSTLSKNSLSDAKQLLQQFISDEDALVGLVQRWKAVNPGRKLLFVIDQTEELITQSTSLADSFQFQKLIKRVMAEHWECLWVVATLRLDFEAQFQDEALREEWMDARFVVPPMGQVQLREAIELPAAKRVLYFEPSSLVDKLVEDVAQTPGALPLLSFLLSEMYLRYLERRSDNRALTETDYRALGGVSGSLTQRATQVYEALVAEDKAYARTVKQVMLRMVAIEGGELARRRVSYGELVYRDEAQNRRVQTLLDRLVASRLLVRGQEGFEAESGEGESVGLVGEPYVEPAHDALVRGWDKLLRWKNEEQEGLALQRRLTPAAKEWFQQVNQTVGKGQKRNKKQVYKKQAKGLLWNANPRLSLLKEVLASEENWLNKAESAFVESSFKLKRKQQFQFVGSLLGVIVSLGALSAGLGVARSNLKVSSTRNFAGRMAAEADKMMSKSSSKQKTGALLAVQAHRLLNDIGEESAAVNQVLRKSLAVLPVTQTFEHTRGVQAVAFNPNGTRIATASVDGITRVWTVADEAIETNSISTRKKAAASTLLLKHKVAVDAVEFGANGTLLATASKDKTAKVWNARSGELVSTVTHQGPVWLASFSGREGQNQGQAQDKWIATASDKTAKVSAVKTGKAVVAVRADGADGAITDVEFSRDGSRVAIAHKSGKVEVWAIATPKSLFSLKYSKAVNAVTFSRDGQNIAIASDDETAQIFNIATKANVASFEGHTRPVRDVRFSRDGKTLATASDDETARRWNAETGREVAKFEHEDAVATVAFSPDSKHLVTALVNNDAAQVWNLETRKASDTLSHDALVRAVTFSADGQRIATASKDRTAVVWDTAARSDARLLTHKETVRGAGFVSTSDGKQVVVTASDDGTVKVWSASTGEETRTLPHPKGRIALSVSRNSPHVATISREDKIARIWQIDTAADPVLLKHEDFIRSTSFSPDGQKVATTSDDKKTRIWSVTGDLVATLAHESSVQSASFNADGTQIATASSDKTAQVWDIDTQKLKITLPHRDAVKEAVFSPDGRYLATASKNREADLWDLSKPAAEVPVFRPQHRSHVNTVRFSDDGQSLVTGSKDGTAKIWDMNSHQVVNSLNHRREVNTVSFSELGDRIVTASADGTALVWNAETGRSIVGLNHDADVIAASFSADGQQIATASKDRSAKVGGTDSDEIVAKVCDRLGSNPTVSDWAQYMQADLKTKVEAAKDYELLCENNPIHPSLIAFADYTAGQGLEDDSADIFRRIVELDEEIDLDPFTPAIDRNPRAMARKRSAPHMAMLARQKAADGDEKGARKLYEQARDQDPTLDLDPSTARRDSDPEAVVEAVVKETKEDLVFTEADDDIADAYYDEDYAEDGYSIEEDYATDNEYLEDEYLEDEYIEDYFVEEEYLEDYDYYEDYYEGEYADGYYDEEGLWGEDISAENARVEDDAGPVESFEDLEEYEDIPEPYYEEDYAEDDYPIEEDYDLAPTTEEYYDEEEYYEEEDVYYEEAYE